jgi:hypothetical protein
VLSNASIVCADESEMGDVGLAVLAGEPASLAASGLPSKRTSRAGISL